MLPLPSRGALILLVLCSALAGAADGEWQHGVSMFGDLKYPADFQHFDYVNPAAPKGGTLVLGTALNFNSFTPFLNKGLPAGAMISPGMSYDGLFTRADDELHTFYGSLVQSVKLAGDFTWAVIRLHPEARWHDGVPVTARDVKFTFEHVQENAGSGVRSALSSLESIEILGERELRLGFRKVAGLNRGALSMLSYVNILPEHYWRTRDLSKTTLEPPLGSGPYRIADFEQGRFILFERVPDYWGRDLPVNRGRHNFDYIRFDFYRDATIAREAFRKGLVDYRTEGDTSAWRTGYNIPAREKGWLVMRKHNFKMNAGFQFALVLNTRQKKLGDVRVREALSTAFDFEWTNRVVYDGYYTRAGSFFADTFLAACGLPTGAERALLEPFRARLPPRLFTQPFVLAGSDGHGRHRDNLLRARELFAAAGWRIRDGVMANDAGEPFELEFLSDSAAEKKTLLPYMDQLKRLGIATNIRLVESSQYVNRLRRFDFDALLVGVRFGFPPGIEILAYFHSRVAHTPSTGNLAGIESEAVDALLAAILDARSIDELTAASRALDRTLLWGYYVIPMVAVEQPRVVYWDKFGRPTIDAEYRTSFPDTWWWDEARASQIRQGETASEGLPAE